MIKTLFLLQRAKETAPEAFTAAWAGLGAPARSGGCSRYVQYHLQPEVQHPPGSAVLDVEVHGAEEIWFENEGALKRFLADAWPARIAALGLGALTGVSFDEREVLNTLAPGDPGQGMLKRLVILVRKPDWSHARFVEHWRDVHAEFAKRVRGGSRYYHQLYVTGHLPNPMGVPTLGVEIDGFSESWFDDPRHLTEAAKSPESRDLAADNTVYVGRSKRLYIVELEFPPR